MSRHKTITWLFHLFYLSFIGPVTGQECQLIELPGEKIHAFTQTDQEGFLWISSKQGWYRHDGNNYKLYTTPVEADTTEYWQNVQSFLFTDKRGRKWYTTYSGLHYYDPEENNIKNVSLSSLGDEKFTDLQIIFHLPKTDELLITVGKKIYIFAPNTKRFRPLGIETDAKRFAIDTFPSGALRTIIGCFGRAVDGVEVFHQLSPSDKWSKKRVTRFSPTLQTSVHHAVITTSGQAYLAAKTGLISFSWKISAPQNKLNWKAESVFEGGNTFSPVLSPSRDEMAFTTLPLGIGTVPISPKGIADFTKMSIDSTRKFYFGVNYQGEDRLWGWKSQLGLVGIPLPLNKPPKLGKVVSPPTSLVISPTPYFQVNHESGSALRISRQQVEIKKKGKTSWEDTPPPAFQSYTNGEVDYIKYLGNNLLLAAINSSTISVYEWTGISATEISTISVGTDINCINSKRHSEEFWIGTPKGLYHSEGPTVELALGKLPLLENINITAILPWQDNWLILGTNQGILFYETAKKKAIWAGWCNELLASSINIDQLSLNQDSGLVTFNSEAGIIEFDPTLIPLSTTLFEPYISNYSINNIPIQQELLRENDQTIKVKAKQNTLGFQLSTIGFDYAEGATITAELIGYDLLPISYNPGDIIRKSGLSSGTYTFRLTAYNGRGEKGQSKRLTIIVIAPLWQRPEFLILVGLLLIGLTYLFLHLRTRQQLRQAAIQLEQQQALAAERDRIASELHDDLGGDLASMAFIIDGHNSLKELGVDAELDVSRLGQLANGAIKHMREMIWVLDDEQATLSTLAKQLLANAREMAAIGDLSLQADIPETLPELPLSSIQKKNILLMAKETMQNIRKHARASAFNLRLAVEQAGEQSYLLLVITDNGQGMKATQQGETDKPLNHGHGLKNLHKRAEEINATLSFTSSIPRGTKVTLRCPIAQQPKAPIK